MHDGLPCNPGLSTYQFDIDDQARRKRAGNDSEKGNDVFGDDENLSFGRAALPTERNFPQDG